MSSGWRWAPSPPSTGPPSAGKSLLTIDLALSLSAGIPWLGVPVIGMVPTLYVLGEGQLKPRMDAWRQGHPDTLATTIGGDENSGQDMGKVIDACLDIQRVSRRQTAVLLVSNPGKDAAKGIRGHSSLEASLEVTGRVTGQSSTIDATEIGYTVTPQVRRDDPFAVPGETT